MTVFIFTDKAQKILGTAKGNLYFDMFLILVGLSVLIYAVYKKTNDKARYMVIGSLFLLLCVNWFIDEIRYYNYWKNEYSKLTTIYLNQEYKIVEGHVEVLYEQSVDGGAGDHIRIDGVEFEFSCLSDTFGYNKTIAYDGVLTEGAFARVYFYHPESESYRNIVIMRIDMLENISKTGNADPKLPCIGW